MLCVTFGAPAWVGALHGALRRPWQVAASLEAPQGRMRWAAGASAFWRHLGERLLAVLAAAADRGLAAPAALHFETHRGGRPAQRQSARSCLSYVWGLERCARPHHSAAALR
eukprot:CAMPEP_0202096176 /NCGR_PEP_ID=MMETSP0965-20130614/463_1 /ASSEMBLY_ACC=CAM_ASM_000507 /TAXON_ID=4773 /ORGANISM="Schizochytrium aggregatum, Strain ATCC28209" /LENGTH=111 /DNA_ID=CAMNT_0048664487 /DNA_START=170 /DNA_END=502 /DNA_ORIENTATION=+